MRFLLDTNVLSHLVRQPQGRIAARIAGVGEERVCTSIAAAAELRYGAARKGSARLSAQVATILSALEVVPFEAPADAVYGEIRTYLERTGRTIGGNDLLIAAHAVALGVTLVTDNEGEFSRIEGLAVVNWLC
jgi:tRNA(fMet)-specific endonuclease VapC